MISTQNEPFLTKTKIMEYTRPNQTRLLRKGQQNLRVRRLLQPRRPIIAKVSHSNDSEARNESFENLSKLTENRK